MPVAPADDVILLGDSELVCNLFAPSIHIACMRRHHLTDRTHAHSGREAWPFHQKRRQSKHSRPAVSKYGNGNNLIQLRGGQSWWPSMVRVVGAYHSPWASIPAIGAGTTFSFSVKMNSTWQPCIQSPMSDGDTYTGLEQILNSTYGTAASVYSKSRILWQECTVEVFRNTGAVNAAALALVPSQPSGTAPNNPALGEAYPLAKSATISNDAVTSVFLSQKVNCRKFFGLTKEQYAQPGFYGSSTADPANGQGGWTLNLKPLNNQAEAANVWAFRVILKAIIELTEPWDYASNHPVKTPADQPESKDDDYPDEMVDDPPPMDPPMLQRANAMSSPGAAAAQVLKGLSFQVPAQQAQRAQLKSPTSAAALRVR